MDQVSILWVDDEIDLLKPHIIFLEQKGYQVDTVNNGSDAVDLVIENPYDIIFLDENMPGISGLETLNLIKDRKPNLPVVMITKSEEEHIMEDAIGAKISDYLIKPVNPKQILLSVKKNLDNNRIVSEKTTSNYQQEFRKIAMDLNDLRDYSSWVEMYKTLTRWELKLDALSDNSMQEVLAMQKKEANSLFSRFVQKNYEDWITNPDDAPVLSHRMMKEFVLPHCKEGSKPVVFIVIDNLRLDQWKLIEQDLSPLFRVKQEETFFSILPTATHYARNALFAGLMPLEISKKYPKLWSNENDEGSKNQHEKEFLEEQLKRVGMNIKLQYHKVVQQQQGKKLVDNYKNLLQADLSVLVFNFVDMLSHAKTEMKVIRELADDDKAYRSLTQTWFKNSALFELFQLLAKEDVKIVVSTDHGTINVSDAIKVVGDRNTNTNLRYKTGKNLSFNEKEVYAVKNPEQIHLPKEHVSSSFIFALEDQFFAYPNNYNHYVKYYKDTFQHGGISLEEMIVPVAILEGK